MAGKKENKIFLERLHYNNLNSLQQFITYHIRNKHILRHCLYHLPSLASL